MHSFWLEGNMYVKFLIFGKKTHVETADRF